MKVNLPPAAGPTCMYSHIQHTLCKVVTGVYTTVQVCSSEPLLCSMDSMLVVLATFSESVSLSLVGYF